MYIFRDLCVMSMVRVEQPLDTIKEEWKCQYRRTENICPLSNHAILRSEKAVQPGEVHREPTHRLPSTRHGCVTRFLSLPL